MNIHMSTLDLGSTPIVPPPSAEALAASSIRETICMVGAKDAYQCSFEDLGAIPVPDATERESTGNVSYQPLPYQEQATAVRSIFAEALNAEPLFETYALAAKGQEMFGKIVFPFDEHGGISIALTNSYNQQLALYGALGRSVFLCANKQIQGESMFKVKHTLNMEERYLAHLRTQAEGAATTTEQLAERERRWSQIPMADDFFFAYAGILLGREAITTHQHGAALRYWRACVNAREGSSSPFWTGRNPQQLHAAHGDRTLASGFQAITGALHRASPQRAFYHFGATDHITQAVALSGGSIQDSDIPAFTLDVEEV